ncbi:hypothetical protein NDU88_004845 [Pleurodeles waltl]|uniref:Uncharacterized protein n=1 Tax=Pleurodeles waltl TaxID=8319 RepID=A0AAV7TT48_PLEWA|nr:hypothetical protein NDU88_004845 [Pleurodeles waltl]
MLSPLAPDLHSSLFQTGRGACGSVVAPRGPVGSSVVPAGRGLFEFQVGVSGDAPRRPPPPGGLPLWVGEVLCLCRDAGLTSARGRGFFSRLRPPGCRCSLRSLRGEYSSPALTGASQ